MGVSRLSGRALVGSRNFQWAADGISTIAKTSEINPDKHLVGRLFYPSADAEASQPTSAWPKSSWLSSFREASGYASFLFFTASTWQKWTLQPLFHVGLWVFGRRTHVPICENSAFAAISADSGGIGNGNGDGGEGTSPYPVIIFSHGVGGTRSTYSVLCAEMASQGFLVLAVEHTDGTASCVQCAGKGGWRNYSGFGKGEVQHAKLAYRMREVATAGRLLESLHKGTLSSEHCQLAGGADASTFLRGRLNLDQMALVGHSFGGATVTAAAAVDMQPRAVVALDPWWSAVPMPSPALEKWKTHTPLLVIGSDAWNTPYNDKGDMVCGRELQRKILAAAHHNKHSGGGALLLVVAQSSHDTFSDLPVLFSQFAFIMAKLGFVTKLEPALGMAAVTSATVQFLHRHLQTKQKPLLPPLITARLADDSSAQVGAAAGGVSNGAAEGNTTTNGQTNGQTGGWTGSGAGLGIASEATRSMSAANPGLAQDPSAGEAAHMDGVSNWDVHSSQTDSAGVIRDGGRSLQDGPERTPHEAEKVPVGAEDEKDMQHLLGDLAATVQLHA